MLFTQRDSEIIYCRPCPATAEDDAVLVHANAIRFHLLYPMSGIETEETLLPEGRMDVLMGQGQTAQVLRNLCYKVREQDEKDKTSDWSTIARLIGRLFSVTLNAPAFVKARGSISLTYRQEHVEKALDIALAGRGLQQTLLVLAYLYLHKGSVLMIDEPDAHLEILRQRQIFEILKDVARDNRSQIVIATHSEVILDDAVDTNLTLLVNGAAVDLATRQDMWHTLRSFGIDHYYRAKVYPRILYIEGSSDLDMLRALAKHIKHPAREILEGPLNCYYTRNTSPEDTLEDRLDRVGGAYGNYRQHFHTLKRYVPELRAIGIFDNDNRQLTDDVGQDFAAVFWKQYELENYFISPDAILRYIDDHFGRKEELFRTSYRQTAEAAIDDRLLKQVFDGDAAQLQEYRKASKSLRRTLLRNVKMSSFAEAVFHRLAKEGGMPPLLCKGDFYELVPFASADDIPTEIQDRLDLLCRFLAPGAVL
jgi:Fe-S cluster assembly ATPase SufC